MTSSRTVLAAAVLTLVGTAAACGAAPDGAGGGAGGGAAGSGTYRIPPSTVDVPLDGPSWMQERTLHVDGRAVDTGVRADSYTLLPHGVLLMAKGVLWFSDTRSRASRVGDLRVGQDGARLSPDGRHVAFLDGLHGPKDPYGDRFHRVDVLDTRTGRQVVASGQGMGDRSEGRNEQYEEYDPSLVALDDDAAYAHGPGDAYWRYPFDGSAPRRVAVSSVPRLSRGGTVVPLEQRRGLWREDADGTTEGNVSPSGRLGLADTLNSGFAPYDVRSGRPLAYRAPAGTNRFALGGWLPGDGFWGFAVHGQDAVAEGRGRVVTCAAGTRTCTPVSGALTSTYEHPVLLGAEAGD